MCIRLEGGILRVVVVAGGSEGMLPGREDLLGADYLIAADGGADIVHAAGGTPDLVVGDMDSISSRGRRALKQDGVEVRVFPCAKDETDLEIALRACLLYTSPSPRDRTRSRM